MSIRSFFLACAKAVKGRSKEAKILRDFFLDCAKTAGR